MHNTCIIILFTVLLKLEEAYLGDSSVLFQAAESSVHREDN